MHFWSWHYCATKSASCQSHGVHNVSRNNTHFAASTVTVHMGPNVLMLPPCCTLCNLVNPNHLQSFMQWSTHHCTRASSQHHRCALLTLHRQDTLKTLVCAVFGTVLILRKRPPCFEEGFTLWHSRGIMDVIVWTTWGVLVLMVAAVFATYSFFPQYNSQKSW